MGLFADFPVSSAGIVFTRKNEQKKSEAGMNKQNPQESKQENPKQERNENGTQDW